jgi:zinc D-Ala-D-Ala carboxypeptidase
MNRLSPNVTLAEAVASNTAKLAGIANTPSASVLVNMRHWCENIFEPTRADLGGTPIHISSFYRAPALNKLIGGSVTSQHCLGQAADLDGDVYQSAGGPSNREIFECIRDNRVFDQLILEGITGGQIAWVHTSYRHQAHNRRQILFMYRNSQGKTVYEPYSPKRYRELVY